MTTGDVMTDHSRAAVQVDLEGDAVVVRGDIDAAGGMTLDAFLSQLPPPAPTVLDIADVDFIDSTGLRTLLIAARRAHSEGSTLVLRNTGTAVRRVLEITGTTELFDLEP
jgi:anti-anti-sigma factor